MTSTGPTSVSSCLVRVPLRELPPSWRAGGAEMIVHLALGRVLSFFLGSYTV
ncbi:MAG: hypothetical protein WBM01_12210 [Mycobacterium sp.]